MTKAAAWATRMLLALLILFSILIEAYFVPQLGLEVVAANPEAQPLFIPALIWSILLIGCGQAILVIVWRLVSLVMREQIFSRRAVRWVRAIIVITFVALALIVAMFVTLSVLTFTAPLAMYGLIGLALFCAAFALIMQTMVGLLRRSTQYREELDEVI